MSKRPDMPCAECGRPMWRGGTSLPEGEARCRECRRLNFEHGLNGYQRHGCRCDTCRGAATEEMRKFKARFHEREGITYSQKYRQEHGRSPDRTIDTACTQCGTVMQRPPGQAKRWRPFCSFKCRHAYRHEYTPYLPLEFSSPPRPPFDPRGPLRRAVEDGDAEGLLAAIKAKCQVADGGCWIWKKLSKDGYPQIDIGGRRMAVHRMTLEARLGAPLGSQAAHHICANPACVNPHHLQPVTHAENNAEMLARTYMVRRIAELEQALATVAPNHPLLLEIGIPESA